MKRHELSRTLRQMEEVRERSYEAGSTAEAQRLDAEYDRMNAAIAPYLTGALQLQEDTPAEAEADRAAWMAAR